MSKFSYKTLLIILFFLLIGIVILWKFVLPQNKAEAAWWNDGWNYRKAVSITNNAGSTLNNQRVKIVIDTSTLIATGKLQSDCDDIRITDINGNLLDHWDTGCDTVSTNVYFKVSSLISSPTAFYIYYGNSSADNIEKILGTFDDPGTSCKMMKDQGSVTASGLYYVAPGGNDSDKIQVYCNTDIIGDAWTLVINNGAYTIPPKPTWVNAVNEVNITGSISNNLDSFDLLLGLKHWNYLGNTALIQMGSNPSTITKRSHYNTFSLNSANNYSLSLSGQVIDLGGAAPGFYSTHNGAKFTTFDGDNDSNSGNCATYYSNTPWWYTSCWSGNIWGGGDGGGYQNKPYWIGSSTDYHNYGGIYIGGSDSMKNISMDAIQTEEAGGGPMAYWKFDEGVGTTAYDSSTNQNNGTISGATWQTEDQCVSGKCLYFNNNEVVTINDNSNLRPENVTVAVWVKINTQNGTYKGIVSKGNNSVGYEIRTTGYTSSTTTVQFRLNGDLGAPGTITVNNNEWLHLVGTYDGSITKFYLNGQLKTQKNYSTPIDYSTTYNVAIGKLTYAGLYFNGFIDEPKIYPYARTPDQIKLDYNSGSSNSGSAVKLSNSSDNSVSDGLIAYWKMDENTGLVLNDSSGNRNNGSFGVGDSTPSWVNGKFGSGVSFNGVRASVGTSITTAFNDFSVSLWFKDDGVISAHERLIDKEYSNGFWLGRNGSLSNSWGGGIIEPNSPYGIFGTFTDGQWNHMVSIRRGNSHELYANGVLVAKNTVSSSVLSNVEIKIGNRNGVNQPYGGLLDEIRIYNRAISPNEVVNLYEIMPTPVFHWSFDEGIGGTAIDKEGHTDLPITNATYTSGKYGSALYFDGNSWLEKAISPSIPANYNYSQCLWINTPQSAARQVVIDDTNRWEHWIAINTDRSISGCYYNGGQICTSSAANAISYNNWHHLCLTYDYAKELSLYIDGKFTNKFSNVGSSQSRIYDDVSIGKAGYDLNDRFTGKIDEVKIYNYPLNQKQVIMDMVGGSSLLSNKSLLGYYKFDEKSGTTVYDSSLHKKTGTLAGSILPSWSNNCQSNGCLSFTASNSNNVTTTSIYNNSSEYTISGFIYPTTTGNSQFRAIFGSVMGNNLDSGLVLPPGGSLNICYHNYLGSGDANYCSTNSPIVLNKWQHVALTYKNGNVNVYHNGLNVKNLSVGKTNTNNYAIIGGAASDNYSGERMFNGMIDEVKIYNYELTADEIKKDYNDGSSFKFGTSLQKIGSTLTPINYCIIGDTNYCTSPVGEWLFEENSGLTTKDTSGNNNNASFGSTSYSPAWVSGKNNEGAALYFDGVDDRVTLASTINLVDSSNWTVSAWVKTTLGGSILSNSSGGPVANDIRVSSNKISYSHYSGTWLYEYGNINVSDGKWHHLTWVNHSNKTMDMYVDGVGDTYGVNSAQSSGPVNQIGRNWGGSFLGTIDQVKIYNYARTPAQIAYDYNKGEPIAWFKFDECQGNIVNNSSSIGITGIINIGSGGSQNTLGTCAVGTSAAWTNGANGKLNSSLSFDGTDDYVNLEKMTKFDSALTNAITIGLWAKLDSSIASNTKGFVSRGVNPFFGAYLNTVLWQVTGLSPVYIQSTTPLSNFFGKWTHFLVTYDKNSSSNNFKIYINGMLDKQATATGTPTVTVADILIGKYSSLYTPGQLDDVRIYNYALTSEQIKLVYNNGAINFN